MLIYSLTDTAHELKSEGTWHVQRARVQGSVGRSQGHSQNRTSVIYEGRYVDFLWQESESCFNQTEGTNSLAWPPQRVLQRAELEEGGPLDLLP